MPSLPEFGGMRTFLEQRSKKGPTKFSYRKLHSPSHFRIFKLFPRSYIPALPSAPHENSIHGSLLETSTEEGISYECLSYTWGVEPSDQPVFLDGCALPITKNLHIALSGLQADDEPRNLWIDALCIDQTDIEERKQQVQLMYNIYSMATSVTVHLGEEGGGSQSIPELVDKIRHAHYYKDSDLSHMWSTDQYHGLGLPLVDDEIWDCLPNFLSRPWFTRVWVLQEALAAQKLHVMCGHWSAIAVGSVGEPGLLENLLLADIHGLPTGGDYSNREAMQSAVRGHKQLWFMARLGFGGMGGHSELQGLRRSLLALLVSTRGCASTDPRDRVFALLNLCNDATAMNIEPDYSITVEEAYSRVARAIVKAGQGGRLLLYAHARATNLEIPSWVPDWSEETIPWYDIVSPGANSEVSDPEQGDICLGDSEDHLVVSGITLSSIRTLYTLGDRDANPGLYTQGLSELLERMPSSGESTGNNEHTEGQQDVSSLIRDSNDKQSPSDRTSIRSSMFPKAGFAATAEAWIGSSPQYKTRDPHNVIWKTLLCYHADSPSMGLPKDCLNCYEAFRQFITCLFDEGYARGQMWTTIIQEIARLKGLPGIEISEEVIRALQPAIAALQPWYREQMKVRQEKAAEFDNAMQRFCFTLQLGMTQEGYVGMLPLATKEGDLVVCVKGVKAPMVLRRVSEEGENFKVIGHAFFHGFMPGEEGIHDLERKNEWQKLTLT